MKKMADLQLSVVTDSRSRQAIERQILQWDENLEKLYVEQYRLRCYSCSLQGTELPNPKTLLTHVSRHTKVTLSRVGVFTVTSLHAFIRARSPNRSGATLHGTGSKHGGILSTFKSDTTPKTRPRSPKTNMVASIGPIYTSNIDSKASDPIGAKLGQDDSCSQVSSNDKFSSGERLVRVTLADNQNIAVELSDRMTAHEVLQAACNRRQLNPNDHFLRLKMPGVDNYKQPDDSAIIDNEEFERIYVLPKIVFQIELRRLSRDSDFGMEVEAELDEESEAEDQLCVFISHVYKAGLAQRKGLLVGDELLVINGRVVRELDMVYVETLLADLSAVCLTVRSCRAAAQRPGDTTPLQRAADRYISQLVCPPPPAQAPISQQRIRDIIVPAPAPPAPPATTAGTTRTAKGVEESEESESNKSSVKSNKVMSNEQIDNLLMGAEQVTHFCRLLHSPLPEVTSDTAAPVSRSLTDTQKLRKVITELIDTERHYVKDLNCLIERYLEPLKEETYLTGEDIEQLFGNIQEIVQFQKMFLHSLEQSVRLEPNFSLLTDPKQFRRILFSLGGSFLYYANHFKLYSSFCASHSKAQRALDPDTNPQLREFLRARNPKQQHSATLESYLIKPIQRILKYPLLLSQLKSLTEPSTDENFHLAEALRGMEAVAEHINEMQKIYEEYGSIFDDLVRQYNELHHHKKNFDLNIGELQMYGHVTWYNSQEEMQTKLKKGVELLNIVFVFRTGLAILAHDKIKAKRKNRSSGGGSRIPAVAECADVIRYQTVIPVDELQVKGQSSSADTERQGLWEVIHSKSEKEGRPERSFRFASSLDAKNEFMKTIRNIIRESVRRMAMPTQRTAVQMRSHPAAHTPGRRPDSLVQTCTARPPGTKQQRAKSIAYSGPLPPSCTDCGAPAANNRPVTDAEERLSQRDQDGAALLRACSQTLPGSCRIIEPARLEHDACTSAHRAARCLGGGVGSDSQSTINSERDGSSSCGGAGGSVGSGGGVAARLLHCSNSPHNYSSSSTLASHCGSLPPHQHTPTPTHGGGDATTCDQQLGSPIWKPRHSNRKTAHTIKQTAADSIAGSAVSTQSEQAQGRTLEGEMFSSAIYGADYSNIVYDNKQRTVMLPDSCLRHNDHTEC